MRLVERVRLVEQAARDLERCLAIDVAFAEAWRALAEAHDRLGHAEQATRARDIARLIETRLRTGGRT
ncbi:MAG: hypothetical protein ACLFV3_09100 [Phycisphaeraceae bacterium]